MTTHPRQVNVCFHGIGKPQRQLEPGEDRYWINRDSFLRILDEVVGREDVRLSFDDGNVSDVEDGLAALQARGLRATFFVLAGRLDHSGSLGPSDVRRLHREGMTIGTHGMDHRSWRRMDHVTWSRELVRARDQIADVLGEPVRQAALPLGRYDRRLLSDLRRLGYQSVHTSDRRAAQVGAWIQPRYSVRRDDTLQSFRQDVLAGAGVAHRLRLDAVGLVKRLR